MNTEPEWPETNAMGTIGWRREPITAAAIQASALASKARLCPTCQSLQPHGLEPATPRVRACNATCWSLQRHVLEPATPRVRACTPTC